MAVLCGSMCRMFMIYIKYWLVEWSGEEGRKKKVQAKSVFQLKIMPVGY